MKRDMELVRKILFTIEEQVDNVAKFDLKVEGYDMQQVAYHCSILYDAGYVKSYNAKYGSDQIYIFGVGGLTWEGHELLESIRQDTIWNKTKDVIKEHALPNAIDVIKQVATSVISSITEGAIRSML